MKFFNHLINSKSKYDLTTYMLKKLNTKDNIKAVTMMVKAKAHPIENNL